ncbi:uridine kinase [Nakamurella sp. YIM 132087]|uniref:Uridine kinase n=1 Tax=Nakamurella alba TaxID=2665158 RepID=A0A7K1FW26_9ACTN|nr:uridine kinase [Nakamurella alba]
MTLAAPPRLGSVRLVAVDGPSGSGKTTFATALAGEFRRRGIRRAVFSTDLLATWDDPFGWWPRLEVGVLQPLSRGEDGAVVVQDWSSGVPRPGRTVTVRLPEVLVLEGVSAGRSAVSDRTSALIWVEIPSTAERLARSVGRDGESERDHLTRWQQDETGHFARDLTSSRADLTVRPD